MGKALDLIVIREPEDLVEERPSRIYPRLSRGLSLVIVIKVLRGSEV